MYHYANQHCRRCGKSSDGDYCDACSEYRSLVEVESLRRMPIICSHCGQSFDDKKFERHRWACFYRDRFLVIKGHRRAR